MGKRGRPRTIPESVIDEICASPLPDKEMTEALARRGVDISISYVNKVRHGRRRTDVPRVQPARPKGKFTPAVIAVVKAEAAAGHKHAAIARKYGMSKSYVSRILNGE